jgi:hypothetical protein
MQPSINNEQMIELLIVRGKAALALNDEVELRRFLRESTFKSGDAWELVFWDEAVEPTQPETVDQRMDRLLGLAGRLKTHRVSDPQEGAPELEPTVCSGDKPKKRGGNHLRPSQELLAYWKALADQGLPIPAIQQKSKERLGSLGVFSYSCVRSHLLKMAKDEHEEGDPIEATHPEKAPELKPAKTKPISGKITPPVRQRMYELFDEGMSSNQAYEQLEKEFGPLPFTRGAVSFQKCRTWVRKEEPAIAPERPSAPEPVAAVPT